MAGHKYLTWPGMARHGLRARERLDTTANGWQWVDHAGLVSVQSSYGYFAQNGTT